MARRGSLREVELVEDDEPGTLGTPDATRSPDDRDAGAGPTGSRRPRRRWVVAGAALAVVALVVAVVGQRVVDAGVRARIAAVADQPGAVRPLDGPPSALWEATDQALYGMLDARTAEGDLVAVQHATQGPVAVAAFDGATGDELWSTELIDGSARGSTGAVGQVHPWSGRCARYPAREHAVVCLVHDGWSVYDDEGHTDVPPSAVRVVLLDTRDGSVVRDLGDALGVVGTRVPSTVTVVGDLVVASDLPGDGQAHVRAAHADGTPAWDVAFPVRAEREGAYVTALRDTVAVVTSDEVRLLDATGAQVGTFDSSERYVTTMGTDRLVLVEQYVRDVGGLVRDGDTGLTVIRADGTTLRLRGELAYASVDDGSVPGLVLTRRDGLLTAWDGEGERLWTTQEPISQGDAMVLDGRVVVDAGIELLALDARTGAELWRSESAGSLQATDGRHLLGIATAAERGVVRQLVALDPADGREVWRVPLADDVDDVQPMLGMLVAIDHSADGLGQTSTVLG